MFLKGFSSLMANMFAMRSYKEVNQLNFDCFLTKNLSDLFVKK